MKMDAQPSPSARGSSRAATQNTCANIFGSAMFGDPTWRRHPTFGPTGYRSPSIFREALTEWEEGGGGPPRAGGRVGWVAWGQGRAGDQS